MVPVVLAGLGLLSIGYYANKRGVFNFGAEDELDNVAVYQQALSQLKNPDELREIGHYLLEKGDRFHGEILIKRAELPLLPKALRAVRRQAFCKVRKSDDCALILKAADAFEREGHTGAAAILRQVVQSKSRLPSIVTTR